jgi:hypothetical protein
MFLWTAAAWAEAPQTLPAHEHSGKPLLRPEENERTFPLGLIGGYLFVEGRVMERNGGFLFDTGTPYPIFFNNAYLPLPLDHYEKSGKAGSAQGGKGRAQQVYIHKDVGPVTVGGVVLEDLGTLRSSDFGYVADTSNGGLRQDLLGFAGLPLVRDLEFVIDYDAKTLTVHRIDKDGTPLVPYYEPSEVVATLSFWQKTGTPYAHLPFVKLDIDKVEIEGLLDTGVLGDLVLTPKSRKKLDSAHRLRQSGKQYVIEGLNYQGVPLSAESPTVTTGSHNTMRLGFNFLRHYRTVWNYPKHTVTLLKPAQQTH